MNVRVKSLVAIAAGCALVATAGYAQAPAAGQAADKNFIMKAGMGGQAEVELGTLAQQRAADPKVKALGERMETDHKKANAELQTIATQKGITIPGGLSKEDQALKARLEKLQGANFDQAYTTAMVNDHTKDIKEFEMASKSADPAIKDFATKTLPTLREHLKMAQEAKGAVGTSGRSGSSGSGTNNSGVGR